MTSAEPTVSTCPDTLHDDDGTIQERPKLLEHVGLGVLSLSCSVLQSVKQLPFPFGSTVRVVEDVIGPPLQPLVTYVKNQSLNMLSYVDDQVFFLHSTGLFCLSKSRLIFCAEKHQVFQD
jgi:hypothetical protein